MGPISLDISIDAPRERVFDALCDLSRRPSWTDHFISEYRVTDVDGRRLGAAARFRVGAPGGIDYMETVIAEAERPHLVSEKGRGGRWDRTAVRTAWELTGGDGSPTRLELTFWTEPGNLVDRVREFARAGGWWRRRWGSALRRLREQLEGDSPRPEPLAVAGGNRQLTGLP